MPQFAACFVRQGHSNIDYQRDVFLNGISGFPVIGCFFIEKINWASCYLFISVALSNITQIL